MSVYVCLRVCVCTRVSAGLFSCVVAPACVSVCMFVCAYLCV